jgi:hypothetical protein
VRKTETNIYCDSPECDTQLPCAENDVPQGWYVVTPVKENFKDRSGTQVTRSLAASLTMCSLECLAVWAMLREEVQRDAARS